MANPKLEARIRAPSGGYQMTVSEDSAARSQTVTVASLAKSYYLSSVADDTYGLLARIAQRLTDSGSLDGTYTLGLNDTTGKVTISATGVTDFGVTWDDAQLRDLLGFTGNISSTTTSYTGANQAQALWLPGTQPQTLNTVGDWAGWDEAELYQGESPAGHLYSISGERKVVSAQRWFGVQRQKTWQANEVTVNESLQRFWRQAIIGEAEWGTAGGPFRHHPDLSDDGEYVTYYVHGASMFKPGFVRENWTGHYDFSWERLIQDPSEVT